MWRTQPLEISRSPSVNRLFVRLVLSNGLASCQKDQDSNPSFMLQNEQSLLPRVDSTIGFYLFLDPDISGNCH
jgi:hypothetical protein